MSATHTLTVTIDATPDIVLPVISGRLSMDETRSPRISANLVCPATAAVLALDPQRNVIYATVTATVTNRIDLIRDISRRVQGMLISGLSALFAGLTIADILPTLMTPAVSTTTWLVQLRAVREDWAADTVSLEFKSAEAILRDHRQPQGSPTTIAGPTILNSVNQLLSLCGLPAVAAADAAASGAASAALRAWPRGVSAWEKVQELIRGVDLLLWPDNAGQLQLQKTSWVGTAMTLTSSGADRTITGGGQFIDRDASDFATAYDNDYVDPAGVSYGQTWGYDNSITLDGPVWHPAAPFKSIYRRQGVPGLTVGSLTSQQAKSAFFRGRGWSVSAVSDYATVPSRPISAVRPSGTIAGMVRSVEFSWPANEMTLQIREPIPTSVFKATVL